MSLRQLLKRGLPYMVEDITTTIGWTAGIYPFSVNLPFRNTNSNTWSTLQMPVDYYSAILGCFGFFRGSMRIKYYSRAMPADATVSIVNDCTQNQYNWFAFSGAEYNRQTMVPTLPAPRRVYPNLEVQVPYYNRTFASNVIFDGPTKNIIITKGQADRPTQYVVIRTGQNGDAVTTAANLAATRQIGEDFSAGFWTGSLPLVGLSNFGTPNVYVDSALSAY